jgi:transcriptional regulator of acetoin/glycerol metabolism
MNETCGNKMEAARRLGISRRALYRRLEKFGFEGAVPAAA